jgi:hypothetical protein
MSNLVNFDHFGQIWSNLANFGQFFFEKWGAHGARMGREWGANGAARARFGPFWHFFKNLSKIIFQRVNRTNTSNSSSGEKISLITNISSQRENVLLFVQEM